MVDGGETQFCYVVGETWDQRLLFFNIIIMLLLAFGRRRRRRVGHGGFNENLEMKIVNQNWKVPQSKD